MDTNNATTVPSSTTIGSSTADHRPLAMDVDSHLEPGADWLPPHPGLAARLPAPAPGPMAITLGSEDRA